MKFLPDVTWPPPNSDIAGLAGKDTINSTASQNKQNLTLVSQGSPVRIVLGRDRIGADVLNVISHNGNLIIQAVWCYAPGTTGIQQIESITFGDDPVPAGVSITSYLGLPTQGIDPTLAAAFQAAGRTYADSLPNVAYSVILIPGTVVAETGMPNISAIIRGAKLYDPRVDARVYTETPSVILAAFINEPWGMDQPVNWSTVTTCADEDDSLVAGKRRRTLGLTLDKPLRTDQWLETLRTYASCWVVPGKDGAELIPDRPTASSRVIDFYQGHIKEVLSFEIRDMANTPNLVRIVYTDTSTLPWRQDAFAEVMLPEVALGAVRRESVVSLEGFHDYSESLRVATERLNKLTLSDLTMTLTVFDDGVSINVGDVVTVTTEFGITEKLFRVLGASSDYGIWTINLAEYDPASYSATVGTTPTYADINLPSPSNPPKVLNLQSVEELYTLRDGTIASRLFITWDPTSFLWFESYYVEVKQGADVLWTGSRLSPDFRTGAVQDNVSLTVNVYTVSRVGAMSEATSSVVTTLGKFALPGNVPYIRGFEVGGECRLEIGPAIDKDLRGLEVRYGVVGVTWQDAKFVDFVPTAPGVGARLVTKDVPAGTWDILCCALDSVEQYSPVPAVLTLTVTTDASAFLVDNHQFVNPSLTNMEEYSLTPWDTVRRFVSEDNLPFSKFDQPLATYTKPLAAYCTVDSALTTESWDFGTNLSGDWTGEMAFNEVEGVANHELDLSLVAITGPWETYTPARARTGARYARMRVAAQANNSVQVELPLATLRVNAVPRSEFSDGAVTSSATSYTRITLENDYVALKGPPIITALGNTPATAVVDNILTGSPTTFDVYIFSSAGVQVSRDFMWEFNGV